MSNGSAKRGKTTRAGGFAATPGRWSQTLDILHREDVWIRVGICAIAAILMWIGTRGWVPPFGYRVGYVPDRDVCARVDFEVENPQENQIQLAQIRKSTPWYYRNDPQPLVELHEQLKDRLFRVLKANKLEDCDKSIWREFYPAAEGADTLSDQRTKFDVMKSVLTDDPELSKLNVVIETVFSQWQLKGLLEELGHSPDEGSVATIKVYNAGSDYTKATNRSIEEVRKALALPQIEPALTKELQSSGIPEDRAVPFGEMVGKWIHERLPATLRPDFDHSRKEIQTMMLGVKPVTSRYAAGNRLAFAGRGLSPRQLVLLEAEHASYVRRLSWWERSVRSLAVFGMYSALFTLCGFYVLNRKPELITGLRKFSVLIGALVIVVLTSWIVATMAEHLRAEVVPLLLFGMAMTIAYEKELALLLSASAAMIVAFSLEQGLSEFVILVSGVAAAVLFSGRIRSRTKLIYVGLFTGCVVALTALGVGTLEGQAFGATEASEFRYIESSDTVTVSPMLRLLIDSALFGFWAIVAGLLMTGLLPFVEQIYEVQTDISLLELGDVAHPLLQQLVRRAPGTYNHSINVGSLGEAAAEAIGANGLLVRVGAYFHDVGKMLKPGYFVENQAGDGNRHDSLNPAMSTLVIIAHVKDGVDLAKKHGLPKSIIDFVEQHHGTTLVEYFFRQATRSSEEEGKSGEVDESSFRYPGPKPQSKETAVMMIADAVESASRTLSDPTPARIKSLVNDLAMKRLLDGQFDECGLTLKELHLIEESLVKSLSAVYHGRVKYPEPSPV